MRRISGMFVALLLCVSLLAPTAGALLSTTPACCMKNMQHSAAVVGSSMVHSHCGGSVEVAGHVPASSPGLYAVAQSPCHGCCSCLGPTISATNKVRPNASFVAPAPAESHPFLSEFYPAESSSSEFRQNPGRAPPSSEPLQ